MDNETCNCTLVEEIEKCDTIWSFDDDVFQCTFVSQSHLRITVQILDKEMLNCTEFSVNRGIISAKKLRVVQWEPWKLHP